MSELFRNDGMDKLIRLSNERWIHITESHPEMGDYKNELIDTIQNPDEIFFSDFTDQYIFVKNFKEFITDNLFIYLKIQQQDTYVITAFPISNKRLSRLKKKWKQVNLKSR